MNGASVLIGIVTYNRAALLPRAISSALAQETDGNVRVAVLDDGSSDETPAIRDQFPTVEWRRWETNRGLIAARNALMSDSNFEYFVGLDDDAYFLSRDAVARALRYLEANLQVAAVGFDILSPDRPEPVGPGKPQPAAMFIGCGHVLRMSSIRQVGCYEISPGIYGGEEKDLCLRLMDAGHRIDRLPGVHVWHEKSSLARDSTAQHRSGVCNDLSMTLRRAPLMIVVPGLLMKMLRHITFSLRHGLTTAGLQGIGMFLRRAGWTMRARRTVKASTIRTFMRLSRAQSDCSAGYGLGR